jgi:cytochrome c556
MTQRRQWRRSVILGGLAVFAVAGCASTETPPKMSSADAIAQRQRLMKLHGALWRDAQDKAKAGQFEAIAVDAEAMAYIAPQIPELFPEGSLSDKSAAKPEIWQKRSEFDAAAKNFQVQSEKLRDAARSKDANATQAVMREFGKNACGSCHTPFRVPPKS